MVPPFRIKIKPVKLEVTETFFAWLQRSIGMTGAHAVKSVQGEINRATGEAALEFIANFMFTAGPIYKVSLQGAMSFVSEAKCAYIHDSSSFDLQAPPLYVVTHLTTEEVQGTRRHGNGSRLDANGFSRYVCHMTPPDYDACCSTFG